MTFSPKKNTNQLMCNEDRNETNRTKIEMTSLYDKSLTLTIDESKKKNFFNVIFQQF